MDIALLYRSKLAFSTQKHGFSSRQCAEAGARNAALGITGFLLVADDYIYELLEGEFSAVSGVFAQVLSSPLGANIEMLSNAPITKRVCHQWSHGIVTSESEAPAELAAKVQMLHHFAARFGGSQPVLRDFIASIGQDIAAPTCRIPRTHETRYALAS